MYIPLSYECKNCKYLYTRGRKSGYESEFIDDAEDSVKVSDAVVKTIRFRHYCFNVPVPVGLCRRCHIISLLNGRELWPFACSRSGGLGGSGNESTTRTLRRRRRAQCQRRVRLERRTSSINARLVGENLRLQLRELHWIQQRQQTPEPAVKQKFQK